MDWVQHHVAIEAVSHFAGAWFSKPASRMETCWQRAKRYREQAAMARALAVDSRIPNVKGQLLSVAAQFEALAEQALLEHYEPKRDDTAK
jgi:hypothetical protein